MQGRETDDEVIWKVCGTKVELEMAFGKCRGTELKSSTVDTCLFTCA